MGAAGDGAVVDGVDIRQDGDSVPRPELPGVLEDVVRYLRRNNQESRVGVAESVVLVDGGDPPALVRQLLAYALAPELGSRIVDVPAVDLLLVLQGFVTEGIQLLDGAQLASASLDEVVGFSGDLVVGEVEGNEREVSAAQANRGRLAGCWRRRAIRAEG